MSKNNILKDILGLLWDFTWIIFIFENLYYQIREIKLYSHRFMSDIFFIYSIINSVFGYLILFGGIFLIKFFTDKLECRKPYKTAILVNVIWFLITFFIISFLNGLIQGYLITIGMDPNLFAIVSVFISVIILIINFLVIALLIKYFYKSGLKDSIFITLAVISIQVFIRIIVGNVLSIIFNLTAGGYTLFYVFQYI
ncbi:MAG: hypothetical protein ACTSP9_08980 [Promethearchaeota archaeon]